MKKFLFLSHILDDDAPTYGNEYTVNIKKTASIEDGEVANESWLSIPLHVGTHVDMPYHFYEEGQTIESYDAAYWVCKHPLFVSIEPKEHIIYEELVHVINSMELNKDIDILLVSTGIENYRGDDAFWKNNPGFSAKLYPFLLEKFPNLRFFGIDSISISSLKEPKAGREVHRAFLDPQRPILILEDMHLQHISSRMDIQEVIVAPFRIARTDGMPCSVIATVEV